jgi:hypothetical protein
VARPPLFVWHLGFWRPPSVADLSVGSDSSPQNEYAEAINRYLKTLHYKLRSDAQLGRPLTIGVSEFRTESETTDTVNLFGQTIHKFCPDAPEHQTAGTERPREDVVTFKFRWWGLVDVTIRFELFTEYMCFCIFLDASRFQKRVDLDRALASADASVRDLFARLQRLEDLSEKLLGHPEQHQGLRSDYEPIADAFYFGLWNSFYKDILYTDESQIESFGNVFIDFRGVVLGNTAPRGYTRVDDRPHWKHFQQPFWRDPGDRNPPEDVVHDPQQKTQFWSQKRQVFWPLMTAPVRGIDMSKHEFAVSQMLDHRALHITALGAQPTTLAGEERVPTCYFLLTETLNGWQIGRLIDRINRLGTLRHAALFGTEQLQKVSVKLRSVEQEMKGAFAHAYLVSRKQNARSPADSPKDKENVERAARDLRRHVSSVAEAMLNIDALAGGNLERRIERSRFYLGLFRQRMSALRIERIEGFQRIDTFIESRFGSSFAFVELLAARYQRARADRAALFSYYLAQETRNVEMATRDRNVEIEEIQGIADFALWTVLVPYYLGSVFSHIFGFSEAKPITGYFWLGWVILGLSIALQRIRQMNSDFPITFAGSKRFRIVLGIIGLGLVVAAVMPEEWRHVLTTDHWKQILARYVH